MLAVVLAMCGPGSDNGTGGGPGQGSDLTPSGSRLGWGFTHTQHSADAGPGAAQERAQKVLSAERLPQNQHLMGWGAGNPEPTPGEYDFESLDRRIELINATGGTPVITLCCAPDWMKGGKEGETDWGELEKAPLPEHYADFAALAAKVAERYDDVRHFQVWNEFKGFYDDDKGRWDHEGYTELYNLVYREVKKVREDSLVGGPYVVMDSLADSDVPDASEVSGEWGSVDQRALDAVSYWNQHKVDADFVVVDGASYTKDDRFLPNEFAATEKFTAVGEWVREETGLPLWWGEWYVEPGDADDQREGWSERHRLAAQAAGMMGMARGGAATAFYWNPQRTDRACPGCLWSGTQRADGGEELPMLELLARFGREFPPGTRFEELPDADAAEDVLLLADADTVLVVNTRSQPTTTEVDGERTELPPYGVRWVSR